MMKRIAAALVMSLFLCACQCGPHAGAGGRGHHEVGDSVRNAVAVVLPVGNSRISGVVRFTQMTDGVRVQAEVSGLQPNTTHGFHIHEFGDTRDAAKGLSAGSHYNPEHHPHAGLDTAQRHAGDLGNLAADARGTARLDVLVKGINLAGLPNPILGRSIVIHAQADDLKTQPTGNSGDRIGVGVIGIAK